MSDAFDAAMLTLVIFGMGGWVFMMGWCFGPGGDDRWCGNCWTSTCPKCRELRAAKRKATGDEEN